ASTYRPIRDAIGMSMGGRPLAFRGRNPHGLRPSEPRTQSKTLVQISISKNKKTTNVEGSIHRDSFHLRRGFDPPCAGSLFSGKSARLPEHLFGGLGAHVPTAQGRI